MPGMFGGFFYCQIQPEDGMSDLSVWDLGGFGLEAVC